MIYSFLLYIDRAYLLYAKINIWVLGVMMACIIENLNEVELYYKHIEVEF